MVLYARLNVLGYRIGTRTLELMTWRNEAQTKAPKREIRFLPALMSIHTQVWRAVFGKPADAIEKGVEHDDECEIWKASDRFAYINHTYRCYRYDH